MVAFHHVNVGVPVDGLDAESRSLTEVLGYCNSFRHPGFPKALFCQDPAGNRWELRGDDGTTSASVRSS
jgi:hypothetical protein